MADLSMKDKIMNELKTDENKPSIKESLCVKKFEEEIDTIFEAYETFKNSVEGLVIGPSVIKSGNGMAEFCNNLQILMLNDIDENKNTDALLKRKKTIIDAYFKKYGNELLAHSSILKVVKNNESADL